MKYIIISGGVVSGLGKGITTASLSFLFKSRGYKVAPVKIDMYLNVDAGTIRPQEHGEVFVTHDGIETDEDLGHYERFLHENLRRENYITTGQIYQEVIRKERAFEYNGEDVEAIPHVTDEITKRLKLAGKAVDADIVIVELGGTVGEYQNGIFFEATRIMKLKNPEDVVHIHVTYLPYLANIGELKSKPAQTSVHILNSMGIHPDFVVARSEDPIDKRRLERLALFCNVQSDHIVSAPNLDSIYKVPLVFSVANKKPFDSLVLKSLGLAQRKYKFLPLWEKTTNSLVQKNKRQVDVAVVGKYFTTGDYKLSDSYVSVIEALKHACAKFRVDTRLHWIDSETLEKSEPDILKKFSGIVVPQGWGGRGTEGKILAARFARENNIPYLGLCFGMQMAVIEFARNVCSLKGANSQEVNPKTPHPVIHIMPNQKEYLSRQQYGGTIRLGAWPCKLKNGSKLSDLYQKYDIKESFVEPAWKQHNPSYKGRSSKAYVYERHRHRYEVNSKYIDKLTKCGLIISGTSPDGNLVEAVEIKDHPFFVGTQFHPEYISRPLTPHPIFMGFVEAIIPAKEQGSA